MNFFRTYVVRIVAAAVVCVGIMASAFAQSEIADLPANESFFELLERGAFSENADLLTDENALLLEGAANGLDCEYATYILADDGETLLRVEYYDADGRLIYYSEVLDYDAELKSYVEMIYTFDSNTNTQILVKTDTYVNGQLTDTVVHAAIPTPAPTAKPTVKPTAKPTAKPTSIPTAKPTAVPTPVPTAKPTAVPTAKPTAVPTSVPTAKPTAVPTSVPTAKPTAVPTAKPTAVPTPVPTAKPTAVPTAKPTAVPTAKPTAVPTPVPTAKPTATPKPEKDYDHTTSIYDNDGETLIRVEYYNSDNKLTHYSKVVDYDVETKSYKEDIYTYDTQTNTETLKRTDVYVNGELESSSNP